MPFIYLIITLITLTVSKYLIYITVIKVIKTLQLSLYDLSKTYKRLKNILQPFNILIQLPLSLKFFISLKLINSPNLAVNS